MPELDDVNVGEKVEVLGEEYERIEPIEGDNWTDEWRNTQTDEHLSNSAIETMAKSEDD
ncbi:hypothetical protein [Schaalia vaccimaxillae]|uniref:hypothetical protein n=1 Tax=Schaalia vaccimaxillae TaxID=183916 RepID=UPI0003B747B6|nr:hypothetical protein [Schaalia vaccimaxillae]